MNTLANPPIQIRQIGALTLQVYPTAEDVAIAASSEARKILGLAVERRGEANAVFATGRSQKQCLDNLTHPGRQALNWEKITGFHLDEYLGIAANHPASFRHYLKAHLTSKVPLRRFYEISGDGRLPLEICKHYEAQLRDRTLDLCFLGVGNNGHLAFNDPAVADFDDPQWVKLVRLDEQNRLQQLNSTAFQTLEAVPQYAFTLTLSAISSIQQNLCIAFGTGKASIVNQLLTGPISASCPASILRQIPRAKLLIDRSAASLFLGE
ncbi:MAG: 6-phosphogluconolactonase [Cyanobacteria bacterium J06627_32]